MYNVTVSHDPSRSSCSATAYRGRTHAAHLPAWALETFHLELSCVTRGCSMLASLELLAPPNPIPSGPLVPSVVVSFLSPWSCPLIRVATHSAYARTFRIGSTGVRPSEQSEVIRHIQAVIRGVGDIHSVQATANRRTWRTLYTISSLALAFPQGFRGRPQCTQHTTTASRL